MKELELFDLKKFLLPVLDEDYNFIKQEVRKISPSDTNKTKFLSLGRLEAKKIIAVCVPIVLLFYPLDLQKILAPS